MKASEKRATGRIRRMIANEAIKAGFGRKRARSEARKAVRNYLETHSFKELFTSEFDFSEWASEPS